MPCSGATPPAPDTSGIPAAVAAAKAADVAVLFLGADQTTEAENFDRRTLGLVGAQEQLLLAVAAANPRVVLVLINGGPIDVASAVASTSVRAIIEAFQPGELGGDAILDILSGVVAPAGRMPYTTYFGNFTERDIRDVNLRSGSGTTYWWMQDPVLFPFGYGLSTTNFTFVWSDGPPPSANSSAVLAQRLTVQLPAASEVSSFSLQHTVVVTNTGTRASDVVVLAFAVATAGSHSDMPLRRLFGFERLSMMAPGENRTVTFASDADSLGIVPRGSTAGVVQLVPGTVRIECGGGGDGQSELAAREYELVGDAVAVEENVWAGTVRPL